MSSVTKQPTADATPDTAPPPPPPPGVQFLQLYNGAVMTQLIEVVLEHQLARRLLDGPRSSRELAEMTGLHEPSLYRVLRALSMLGVFTEQPERRFELGPVGPSAAKYDEAFPWFVAAMNELPRSVRTGTTGMELAHGTSFFDYVTQHPAAGRNFDVSMTVIHEGEAQAVAETYDFTGVRTLVDVGGGNGTRLARSCSATRTCAGCCSTCQR